MFLATIYWPF